MFAQEQILAHILTQFNKILVHIEIQGGSNNFKSKKYQFLVVDIRVLCIFLYPAWSPKFHKVLNDLVTETRS
jgi:hypothetical protein